MATPKLCSVISFMVVVILCSELCLSARKGTRKKPFSHNNERYSPLTHEKRATFSMRSFVNQTSYLKLTNICAKNSTACSNSNRRRITGITGESGTSKEVTRLSEFSKEKSQIRLNNGTILWRQPMVRPLSDVTESSTKDSSVENDEEDVSTDFVTSEEKDVDNSTIKNTKPNKLRKKILHVNADEKDFDYDNGVISRILPTRLQYTSSANISRIQQPTITLAQLARKLIFPDWLWTRFAVDRKTGISAVKLVPNPDIIPTISPPQMPTITLENNFSKFMKLFSNVRIQNSECLAPSGQNGTCYQSQECSSMGGTATAPCAQGFGVCCVFLNKCGDTTSRNGTYFIDNAMKFTKAVTTCNIHIRKVTPFVRQMRLDFHIFSLQPPNAGNCDTDRFVVSAQNTNNIIPILCGQNSGSHIYVETDGPSNGIQLSIMTTGEGPRRWSIKITQYETNEPSGAPSYCLQYHTGVMGKVRSFNYNSDTSPQYLNNLNYALCIRKEAGFCSITFSNTGPDNQYYAFQIVNANEQGNLVLPSGQAGVGVRDCPYDYIVLNGYRLCGERLNDATTGIPYVEDAAVTDISNGPFLMTVRTNEIDVGGGFSLYYRQNPCMSTPG